MKNNFRSMCLAAITSLACQSVVAYDFTVDNYCYEIISQTEHTVSLSHGDIFGTYHDFAIGHVTIPTSVEYLGETYTVTSIGHHAFYFCENMTSIEIPSSVTSIDYLAFCFCTGLTSIEVPNSVTSIGGGAFCDCYSLESISLPFVGEKAYTPSEEYQYPLGYMFGTLKESGYEETIQFLNFTIDRTASFYIPASLKSVTITGSSYIPFGAFSNCTNLTTIKLSECVTTLGSCAFDGCTGLTSIEIPNSVTSIGNFAFSDCRCLKSIEIPNSVTNIGIGAFCGCIDLTSVTMQNSVTNIGIGAFQGCTGLTNVEIPNSVTYLGAEAFEGCTSLTSVGLPNSLTHLGKGAFQNCTELTEVKIPSSVTHIGACAFKECSRLWDVEVPNSVTSIGDSAFYGSFVNSVDISNRLTSLGVAAFNGGIGTLTINCDIEDPKKGTCGWFSVCYIGEVIMGETVNRVGKCAFYDAEIDHLTIGSNVQFIDSCAFENCAFGDSVCVNAIVPPVCHDSAFGGYAKDCCIYVPQGTVEAYKSANVWKDFYNIEENPNVSALKSIAETDTPMVPLYDLLGRKVVASRPHGLYVRDGKRMFMK